MNINNVLKDHSILGYSGGSVKSVQRGVATFGGSALTVNISEVDMNKSIVKISTSPESASGSTTPITMGVLAELKSGTQIALTKFDNTYFEHKIQVAWEVIEFEGVKSLQRGTNSFVAKSGTVPIQNVNSQKSILFFSFRSGEDNFDTTLYYIVSGAITSDNMLSFNVYSAKGFTVSWQVIEFK